MIAALAIGDFKERVRRPVYGVTLVGAALLGYVAVPPSGSTWTVLNLGSYRGAYTSAYVGLLVALSSAIWLSLGGFYVIRGAITRDERTGVGPLLAATPLRNVAYLGAKLLSNVMVLASMLGILAVTALVMQLARGESYRVDPVALVTPFVVLALPIMVMVAAVALAMAMETIRPLRAGGGNILWFFVWMVLAIGGQSPSAPLGGLGLGPVARSMPHLTGEFSLGFMELAAHPRTFVWAGLPLDASLITTRVTIVVLAAAVGLVPALWFARFASFTSSRPVVEADRSVAWFAGLPRVEPRRGNTLLRLIAGEFRILTQRVPGWAALALIPFALVPGRYAAVTLLVTWIVPVIVWSRLGTQARESGMDTLLAAYPSARPRLLAEWLAGVALTALTGAPAALRLALAADLPGVLTWTSACLAIPAAALLLGVLTGSPRPFQVLYLGLWWAILNGVAALDFMGVIRGDGPSPLVVTGMSVLFVIAACGIRDVALRR